VPVQGPPRYGQIRVLALDLTALGVIGVVWRANASPKWVMADVDLPDILI
jgi:hypothetical protein